MSRVKVAEFQQRGFGLIEVLIALAIFSIGLLGMIRLQVIGLQSASSAANRAAAVNLGKDILERMRVNRNASLAGSYILSLGASPIGDSLADIDLGDLTARAGNTLPDGQAEVSMAGPIATVRVRWSEPWDRDDADGKAEIWLRSEL